MVIQSHKKENVQLKFITGCIWTLLPLKLTINQMEINFACVISKTQNY
jgi:hypothetical protein